MSDRRPLLVVVFASPSVLGVLPAVLPWGLDPGDVLVEAGTMPRLRPATEGAGVAAWAAPGTRPPWEAVEGRPFLPAGRAAPSAVLAGVRGLRRDPAVVRRGLVALVPVEEAEALAGLFVEADRIAVAWDRAVAPSVHLEALGAVLDAEDAMLPGVWFGLVPYDAPGEEDAARAAAWQAIAGDFPDDVREAG